MRGWRRWIGVGAALGVIVALVPVVRGNIAIEAPLRKLSSAVGVTPKSQEPPKLEGLDLLRLDLRPQRVLTPLKDGQTAELTLDPAIQRAARAHACDLCPHQDVAHLAAVGTGVLAGVSPADLAERPRGVEAVHRDRLVAY